MFIRKKLWLGLSAAIVTSTALSAGAADAGAQAAENPHAGMSHGVDSKGQGPSTAMNHSTMMAAEGGEGGEGSVSAATVVNSDAAYLRQLALMRGHLNVGLDLYRSGEFQAAATHMKHPEDELYAGLVPGFEARGAASFANDLGALATVIEKGGSVEEADAAYEAVLAAIGNAEKAAGAPSAAILGKVIHGLVLTAAKEFDIAVDEGRVVNGHEYQDALGFVRIAQDLMVELANLTDKKDVLEEIHTQLGKIASIWPGVVPPQTIEADPGALYGAAARIELATLGL
jgi:hypothetical protein